MTDFIPIPPGKRKLAETLHKQLAEAAGLLDQAHATAKDFYGSDSAEARELKVHFDMVFGHAEELAASLHSARPSDLTINR